MYTLTWTLKIHQLHEFAIHTSSQSGNERWQLFLVQLAEKFSNFLDLNPHFYGNLNNMKLDLNASTKQSKTECK